MDLRLDCPFPALREYVESYDMSKLDSMAYGHTPYLIVLLKCLDEWKASVSASLETLTGGFAKSIHIQHDGKLPSTSGERSEFKDSIRSKQRADVGEHQNFEEALGSAYRAWTPTKVPVFPEYKCGLTIRGNH